MDFLDAVTFLADPSGTLYATKKTADAAADAIANQQKPSGGSGPATSNAGQHAPQSVGQCCKEYEIRDGFLLNTRTGAVWEYDKNEKKFKHVERVDSEISKAAWGLFGNLIIDDLIKEGTKAQLGVHHSVAEEYKKNIDSMVKLLKAKMK